MLRTSHSLTDSDLNHIIDLRFNQHLPMYKIADIIGCNVSTVYYHISKCGIPILHEWTEEDEQKLALLYAQKPKVKCKLIAQQLNRSEGSISNKITELRRRGLINYYRKSKKGE